MGVSQLGSLLAFGLLYFTADARRHRLPETMIVLTGKRVLLFVVSFAACQVFLLTLRLLSGSGYMSAWLRRGSMLVGLEYCMAISSALMWNRLTDLVPKRSTTPDANYHWRRDLIKSFTLLWLCLAHFCLTLFYFLVGDEPHWLALMCFLAVALYIHMTALTLGATLLEVCLNAVARRIDWDTDVNVRSSWPHRLIWCSRLHTVLCLLLSALMVSIGLYTTSLPPIINEVPVRLRRLPPHLNGMRVALVTDVHIGPTVGRARINTVVDVINQAAPDIVAIVGDLTDGDVSKLWRAAEPIANIKSTKGTFYVTGNHEYYHGKIDEWLGYLKRNLSVVPLRNQARRLGMKSGAKKALCLAGVDDISAEHTSVSGHRMNITAALSGCIPGDAVIVLAHQPAAAQHMLRSSGFGDKIDLVLAGHTHAGQMYVIAPLSYMANPFYHGLYSTPSGAQVYVSAGVNFWGPPVKMWRLTEVPVLTLYSANADFENPA